ncbi:MAG TPA: LysR family transcriptional regulator [Rhodopila sp.]|nr:LysR family transcriptional regulator [Rhodopila sp.]
MELRHLRYFLAVAEEGGFTLAAERLHTAQPSLSRQIRDLEREVGTALLIRGARGVELTAPGRAFLDHARLAITQAQTAVEAARRASQQVKPTFALGFLTGVEMEWLPEAMRVLKDELPRVDVTVSSQYSPDLAEALVRGKLDLAFMRPEPDRPTLAYRVVQTEPLIVVMASDHRLTAHDSIAIERFKDEVFLGMSKTAPSLQRVIDEYLQRCGVDLKPEHLIDNLGMAMSLVASTGGVALIPALARNFLPWSVTSRPLAGEPPTIDLVVGYNTANTSPTLKLFLSQLDQLIAGYGGTPAVHGAGG